MQIPVNPILNPIQGVPEYAKNYWNIKKSLFMIRNIFRFWPELVQILETLHYAAKLQLQLNNFTLLLDIWLLEILQTKSEQQYIV